MPVQSIVAKTQDFQNYPFRSGLLPGLLLAWSAAGDPLRAFCWLAELMRVIDDDLQAASARALRLARRYPKASLF